MRHQRGRPCFRYKAGPGSGIATARAAVPAAWRTAAWRQVKPKPKRDGCGCDVRVRALRGLFAARAALRAVVLLGRVAMQAVVGVRRAALRLGTHRLTAGLAHDIDVEPGGDRFGDGFVRLLLLILAAVDANVAIAHRHRVAAPLGALRPSA